MNACIKIFDELLKKIKYQVHSRLKFSTYTLVIYCEIRLGKKSWTLLCDFFIDSLYDDMCAIKFMLKNKYY